MNGAFTLPTLCVHSSPDGIGGGGGDDDDGGCQANNPHLASIFADRNFWRFIVWRVEAVAAAAAVSALKECRVKVCGVISQQANNSSQKFVHKIPLTNIYNSANCMGKNMDFVFS
jgi:hypothetical protein